MIYIVAIVFISGGIIMKVFPPKFDSGIYGFRTKNQVRTRKIGKLLKRNLQTILYFLGYLILY